MRVHQIGETVGLFTIVDVAERDRASRFRWLCQCQCGGLKIVREDHLQAGLIISCGCHRLREMRLYNEWHRDAALKAKHVRAATTWRHMWDRCTKPGVPKFVRYGGRGIRVCPQWSLFENFLADMGDPPAGRTIDRIDNEGHYEPSNCRWATAVEQAGNRRPRERPSETCSGRIAA